jgi:hypothetical protein
LAEIDLNLHARLRDVVTSLTSPFFLSWTDLAQYAVYLVQRDPANSLVRVDLPSSTATPVITGLPFRPSGIAVNMMGGVAYISTDGKIVEVKLGTLPMGEPVFLGVGHVPSTKISSDGYATTDASDYIQVKDSPFGGTLYILGNLSNFLALGATHYQVTVSYSTGPPPAPGTTPASLTLAWSTNHWNPVTSQFDPYPVAPDPAGGVNSSYYAIPTDYAGHAERWYPSFLMMKWPSGTNGWYTFQVNLFKKTGTTFTQLTSPFPSGNSLTVLIDNSTATVDVVAIRQHGTTTTIPACTIVSSGTSVFDVEVTAYDPNQHLLSYTVTAYWGHNASSTVFSDSYSSHINAEGPRLWSGIVNSWVPAAGWQAQCNCAHTFFLDSWKRTIDGYNYLIYQQAHQSITINNTGTSCQQ